MDQSTQNRTQDTDRQTKQNQNTNNPEGVTLAERLTRDLTAGWTYYSVDGHKPLASLRDISETLTGAGEMICRPPVEAIRDIHKL